MHENDEIDVDNTPWVNKKQDTKLLPMTSPNPNPNINLHLSLSVIIC